MPTCPECNGSNVKKCSLVYAQESRSSVSSGGGLAVGLDGSVDVVSISTAGRSVSDLGKRVAPPRPPKSPTPNGWMLLASLALVGIAIGVICYFYDSPYQEDHWKPWVYGGLCIAATVASLVFTAMWWMKELSYMPEFRAAHAKAMREWESKWMCLSCGRTFKPEAAKHAS